MTRCSSSMSSLSLRSFSYCFFLAFSSIYFCSSICIWYLCCSFFFSMMFFSSRPPKMLPCFSNSISSLPSTTRPLVMMVGKSALVCMGEYICAEFVAVGPLAVGFCWLAGALLLLIWSCSVWIWGGASIFFWNDGGLGNSSASSCK